MPSERAYYPFRPHAQMVAEAHAAHAPISMESTELLGGPEFVIAAPTRQTLRPRQRTTPIDLCTEECAPSAPLPLADLELDELAPLAQAIDAAT
jgi:hypothetical protein